MGPGWDQFEAEGLVPQRDGKKKKWIGIPSVAFCFSYSTPMRSDRLQNMVLGDMESRLPPHHSVNPDLDA